jgi:hypothetical protein
LSCGSSLTGRSGMRLMNGRKLHRCKGFDLDQSYRPDRKPIN